MMVRWTYPSKEISNGLACATNLTKLLKKSSKHEHKIYDLRPMKLESDCRNGFILSTHILFWFKLWLYLFEVSGWRSLRQNEPKQRNFTRSTLCDEFDEIRWKKLETWTPKFMIYGWRNSKPIVEMDSYHRHTSYFYSNLDCVDLKRVGEEV
jgi:hypothetical protein